MDKEAVNTPAGKEVLHQDVEKETAKNPREKEVVGDYSGKEALERESPGADSDRRMSFAGKDEPFMINGEPVGDPDAGLNDEERAHHERALLWKLDLRLVPWLSLLYLISFLDRMCSSAATLDGP